MTRTSTVTSGEALGLVEIGDGWITVTPRGTLDAELVADFGESGVDRLVFIPPFASPLDEIEEFLRAHAPEKIGA